MPMYEYNCVECNQSFELLRPMNDHPKQCPGCNRKNTVKLSVSRTSFALKGTGWYKTDYGNQK